MQTKKHLLFACATLIGSSTLLAQDWKVSGNALTAPGKLGTTSNQDINFISNNIVNGILTKTGRWGFGTTSPSTKLHINSAAGEDALRVQVNGSTKLILRSNGGLSVGSLGSAPALGLFVSGNTGIGTSTPSSKLHVKIGNSGTTPFSLSTLSVENSDHNYISILTPTASESGILFGNAASNVSGGIFYNSSFFGANPNGLQFRTNGNLPRMTLTSQGNLGIGTVNPENFKLKIIHGNSIGHGLAIENSTLAGIEWELFAGGGNGPLNVIRNGAIMGQFSFPSGQYFALSDERLKTGIKPMSTVLEKIRQLKPSSYQFKSATTSNENDGFLAQEVMKVFPNLVSHINDANMDVYTMDYSGFGVIAIKGIQELMNMNEAKDAKQEAQQKQIDALQKQLDDLKALVLKGTNSNALSLMNEKPETNLAAASLEQNIPNPFAGSTTIHYRLPQKFSNAQVVITDKNGNALKRIAVSGGSNGRVMVDASSLLPGSYNYTLIVDGKSTGTKQMIIIK